MNRLILCRLATIGCGLLAAIAYTHPSTAVNHSNDWNAAALEILSAIFGTQWVEYQKRQAVVPPQPSRFNWLRKVLFGILLGMTLLTANAQTTWTDRFQGTGGRLVDVAYGANVYVAVGDDGTILRSEDSKFWTTAIDPGPSENTLGAVVYAMGQFVAVGYMGRLFTSTDGMTWTARNSGTTKTLRGITYGGGKFIAVGRDGTAILSTNGQTWTGLSLATNSTVNDITYGAGWFVAVGEGGLVQSSSDGINWSAHVSQTTADLQGVTVGSNGSWVAMGKNGTITTTSDRTNWSSQTVNGPGPYFTAVTYNYAQGLFVAVAMTGDQLYLSTDRKNWTAYPTGADGYLSGIRYINDQFITLGEDGTIRTSYNGKYWQSRTLNYDIDFKGIAYGNTRYVAVGVTHPDTYVRASNLAAVSTDGIHYALAETFHPANGARQFNDVAFGNGLFAAVGEDGFIETSADGRAWDFRQVIAGQTLNAVAFGAGRFVAIGNQGYIARSSDGKTWNSGFTGLSSNFRGLTFANGQFMAVGENGAIATSPDGIIWTAQSSLTNQQLQSAAFGNGRWVVVGYEGVVGYRITGLPWAVYSVGTGIYFSDVVFSNGQFVAVGLNKKLFTSTDGISWTAHKSTMALNSNLHSLVHGNGLWVAVGSTPFVITSPDDATKAANASARVAADEPEPGMGLQVKTFPNPVIDDFTAAIEGVSDQPVRLWLVDASGHTVIDRQITVGYETQQETMSLARQNPGMYTLRVSTAGQIRTLKVLKQ